MSKDGLSKAATSEEFKAGYYLFNPKQYGRIFVFVDFSNVRQWAKSFWPEDNKNFIKKEIDIKKLSEVIEWIKPEKKFFYYGYYQEYLDLSTNHRLNIKYRSSIYRIDKARKSGFKTRQKIVKMIKRFDDEGRYLGEQPKCNFDVEITKDIILKMDKYDTIFLWTGDSDFSVLFSYLRDKEKKIITICTRNFISSELRDGSDLYIPADPLKNFLEYLPTKKHYPTKKAG